MLFNLLFGNEQSIAAENKQHKLNKKVICHNRLLDMSYQYVSTKRNFL